MNEIADFLKEHWLELCGTAGTILCLIARTKTKQNPEERQKRKIEKSEAKFERYLAKAKAQGEKISKLKEKENANNTES